MNNIYSNLKLHLTYSGFRRSTSQSSEVIIVNATNSYPPYFKVYTKDNNWEFHAISSDIILYLLKRSINLPTKGDKPSIQDSEDYDV